jgi:hypothetical protein
MYELDLSRLQTELLRSGVAPRHVRRTVDELSDHYEDLVEQGLSEGLDSRSARSGAMTSLGEFEDIAQAVRAQPELRSWAFRFPRVAAVVYPLTCAVLLPAAPVFIGAAHATHLARWALCLFLSAVLTAAMFLMLQMAITLT